MRVQERSFALFRGIECVLIFLLQESCPINAPSTWKKEALSNVHASHPREGQTGDHGPSKADRIDHLTVVFPG